MPTFTTPDLPCHPFVLGVDPANCASLNKQGQRIAARAVIADIESEGYRVELDGLTWYDVRAMQDIQRMPDEWVAMNTEAIQYAVGAGLVGLHPQRPYLLHVLPAPSKAAQAPQGHAGQAATDWPLGLPR